MGVPGQEVEGRREEGKVASAKLLHYSGKSLFPKGKLSGKKEGYRRIRERMVRGEPRRLVSLRVESLFSTGEVTR